MGAVICLLGLPLCRSCSCCLDFPFHLSPGKAEESLGWSALIQAHVSLDPWVVGDLDQPALLRKKTEDWYLSYYYYCSTTIVTSFFFYILVVETCVIPSFWYMNKSFFIDTPTDRKKHMTWKELTKRNHLSMNSGCIRDVSGGLFAPYFM